MGGGVGKWAEDRGLRSPGIQRSQGGGPRGNGQTCRRRALRERMEKWERPAT